MKADADASNYMSVSFQRMEIGDIGMFYLRKDKETGTCKLYVTRSENEAETWSKPVCCTEEEGYVVVKTTE